MLTEQNEAGNRTLYAFQEGDNIVMNYYGYYLYDSDSSQLHSFSGNYYEVNVGPNGLEGFFNNIADDHKGTQEYCYRYKITDIYGNVHYTQWIYY